MNVFAVIPYKNHFGFPKVPFSEQFLKDQFWIIWRIKNIDLRTNSSFWSLPLKLFLDTDLKHWQVP